MKIKGSKRRDARREVAYSKLNRPSWRGNRQSITSVGSQGKRTQRSPLHDAVCNGDVEEIKRILKNSAEDLIDNVDEEGMPPLHQATKNGLHDVVMLLIEQRASVNLLCEEGNTPLHTALR